MKVDIKERFLCIPEIVHRTGMSKATIYNRINQGLFPKQIPIGSKSCCLLGKRCPRLNARKIDKSRFYSPFTYDWWLIICCLIESIAS